jgi:hypothetical protein
VEPTGTITQTEYARRRGCDVTTVRAAIRDGRIAEAVAPDGTSIADAELADRLWAERTTGKTGPKPTTSPGNPTLEQARAQHMAERLAAAQEELDRLAVTTEEPDRVWAYIARRFREDIEPTLRGFPRLAMARLAGLNRREISTLLQYDLVNELVFDPLQALWAGTAKSPAEVTPAPILPANRSDMEARLRVLQAERMRIERGLREGRIVLFSSIVAEVEDRLARLRTNLMALRFAVLDDAREVVDILEYEVEAMLDRLAAGEHGPDLRQIAEPEEKRPAPQALPPAPLPIVPSASASTVNSRIARVLRQYDLRRTKGDREAVTFARGRTTVRVWVGARWELRCGHRLATGKGATALAAALAA